MVLMIVALLWMTSMALLVTAIGWERHNHWASGGFVEVFVGWVRTELDDPDADPEDVERAVSAMTAKAAPPRRRLKVVS